VNRANDGERSRTATRATFEQAGAAMALVEVRRQDLKNKEAKRAAREATARGLRAQIEELRGQLARYAEALEEDLSAGREKVASRAREGLEYEERFENATRAIVSHLKGKAECRELLNDFIAKGGAPAGTESHPQKTPT
jgi:eukaryotic-like serine/threonine-protein kinase